MAQRMGFPDQGRGVLARRLPTICAVAALGLAMSTVTAYASTVRSASSTGWGTNWGNAIAVADANANGSLYDLASSYGETCINVTYSDNNLVYIVPGGGGYVFSATATGTCSP